MIRNILGLEEKDIGFIGLSFKEETSDIRESPVVTLITEILNASDLKLFEKGFMVRIHDPLISSKDLTKTLPHLSTLLTSLDEVLEKSRVLVITQKPKDPRNIYSSLNKEAVIVDLQNCLNKNKLDKDRYVRIC